MTLTNGLVVMTPSSIAYSGTSASINADGSVDFSAVTSLSLNGVFTSDYDNYMIVLSGTDSLDDSHYFRLRDAGVNDSTANSYVRQYLQATGTSIVGGRITSDSGAFSPSSNTPPYGYTVYIFGPYLAQPTGTRSTTVSRSSVIITDWACVHSVSDSFDGVTIYPGSPATMSGLLTVFGFNQ